MILYIYNIYIYISIMISTIYVRDFSCDCLRRKFPPLGYHKRILNSPYLLVLLIHTKHKTIRWNLGLNSRLHSLEGEFIHWVDKAKNVWLTVGLLHIKAGWWNAPLKLQYFSHKHKIPTTGVAQKNPELPPASQFSWFTQSIKQ